MTPSELKHLYETHNPNGHFFSRGSMKFAGDTMRNFRVVRQTVIDTLYPDDGKRPDVDAWCLYRRRPTHFVGGFVRAFSSDGREMFGYEPKP